MQQVDAAIAEAVASNVSMIGEVGRHILQGGGKRIRPMLLLLSARACGCADMASIYRLAAIVEIIHTTTLLHDDVVDNSDLRRGLPTANVRFGNPISVLVGDFLYSRAFQWMVSLQNMSVMAVLSEATNVIAEGEVLQLVNKGDIGLSEENYLQVIRFKTAKLFEASARLGGLLSGAPLKTQEALASYGGFLGTAFQVIDDLLDFSGNAQLMGKSLGDDLAEGKTTLPLIYAMKKADTAQAERMAQLIGSANRDGLAEIIDMVIQTGAIEATQNCAKQLTKQAILAIEPLPDSLYKKTLVQLARFVSTRTF